MMDQGMIAGVESMLARVNLEPALKKALRDSLGALAGRQDRLIAELREAIAAELDAREQAGRLAFPIYSFLADKDHLAGLELNGFYAVPAGELAGGPVFFLSVPYEEFSGCCSRRYEARSSDGPVEYELCPYYGFMEAERQLDLLWRLYGISSMRPFAPWLRRAVSVRILGKYSEALDLCLEKNGLKDKLLINRAPVWNVEIRTVEKASGSERVAPRGGGQIWRYYYTARDGGKELWALPEDVIEGKLDPEELDVHAIGEDIILASGKRLIPGDCRKFIIHRDAQCDTPVFANGCAACLTSLPVTRGQFNRFLAGFATGPYSCRMAPDGAQAANDRIITRYAAGHRNGPRARQLLLGRNPQGPEVMDIEFLSQDGDDIFLGDYANYVLEDMERRMPLFSWRGIRA